MKIDTDQFIQVSQILERDAKFASYKFALLRATIDSIQQQDHHNLRDFNAMILPTGFAIVPYSMEFAYDRESAGAVMNITLIISFFMMWGLMIIL